MSLYNKAASLGVEEEETESMERNNVERRRYCLTRLPKMYTPGHRQRYLFLNLDNIASALLRSNTLYRRVDGATTNRDLFLNFEALTKHLRGHDPAAVKFQLAAFCKTTPCIAHALERFEWKLKPIVSDENALYNELLEQLAKGAANANGKTLVLAAGDGCLGTANTNAYREIICKFLKQGWYVEIHAWLYALNNGYLRLQSENPGRVVVKPLDDVVCVLVHPNEREYLHTARKLPNNLSGEPVHLAQPRRSAISVRDNAASKPAYFSPIGKRIRPTSAPPMTPRPTSWADVVTQGRTPRTATPETENSSPGSTLFGLADTSQSVFSSPVSPAWVPAPPHRASPLFTPIRPPLSPSSVHSGLMWSLQLQQMQDLLSSQQADLAMRQTVLQQTTELMRLMREQEQHLQAPGEYQQARGPPNPWSGAGRF